MSKSIEALKRIETVVSFNRENKPNYYNRYSQSSIPFYEDFDKVMKDLEVLEILKKYMYVMNEVKDMNETIIQQTLGLSICNTTKEKDFIKVKEWLNEY